MAPKGKRYTKAAVGGDDQSQLAEFRTNAAGQQYPVAPFPYPCLADEEEDLYLVCLNNMQIKYRNTHQEGLQIIDVPAAENEVNYAYQCFTGNDETQMFKNPAKNVTFEQQVDFITSFQYKDPTGSKGADAGEYEYKPADGKNKAFSAFDFYNKGATATFNHGTCGMVKADYDAAMKAGPGVALKNIPIVNTEVTYNPNTAANAADKFTYNTTFAKVNEDVTDYLATRADQDKGTLGAKADATNPNKREADAAKAQLDCIVHVAAYIHAKYEFDEWVIRQVEPTHPQIDNDGARVEVAGPRGVVDEDGWGHWACQQANGGNPLPYWTCSPIPAGMVSFLTTDGREVYAAESQNDEAKRCSENNCHPYLHIKHAAIVKGNGTQDFMPLQDTDLEFANNYQVQKTTKPRLPLMFGSDVPFGKKWEANKAATLAYRPTAVDDNVANDYYGDYSFGYDLDYDYSVGYDYPDYSYGYDYSVGYSGDYDYDYDF